MKIGDDKVDVLSRLQYVRPTFAGPANAPNVFITIGALYAADSKEIVAIVVTGEASDEPGGAKLVTKILPMVAICRPNRKRHIVCDQCPI